MGEREEGTSTMNPGYEALLGTETERDPDILLTRLAYAFKQYKKMRRNEQEALSKLSRIQQESRTLSEDFARLKGIEFKLSTAITETRELRVKAEVATAKLTDLENLREENRELREQARRTAETQKALTLTQLELRELRMKLQSADARLADAEPLADENRALRQEVAELREHAHTSAAAQAELRELRMKLQSADARLADAERLADENRALRQEVAELREQGQATAELEQMSVEYRNLRVDHEQMVRRVANAERDHDELVELRDRNAELVAIEREAIELRDRKQSLEAQLFAAGIVPRTRSTSPQATPNEERAKASDLETNLQSLIGPAGARSAVLADHQGLLVAGSGDPLPQEGLAAFSGCASEFGARAKTFLPIGTLRVIRMTDSNGTVVACRLFDCNELKYGLATIASGETEEEQTERVVGEIARSMTAAANALLTPSERSPSGS
jgi:hypothetical protein